MRRLLTPKWIMGHLAMIVLVVSFLYLARWQFQRAVSGNALSIGYAIQWPVFAGFVVFMWIKEVRAALRPVSGPVSRAEGSPSRPRPGQAAAIPSPHAGPAYDDHDDPQLAEYNRYLAWLNANPTARSADYPG